MESIWNNTFYNNHPALSWVYLMNMSEYGGANTYEKFSVLEKAIVDIQVGKRESEYTSVYYGGLEFKKFTRANNTNNFTVKFNEDKHYSVTKALEYLYNCDNLNQDYPLNEEAPYNDPLFSTQNEPKSRIIKVYGFDPNLLSVQVPNNENPMPSIEYTFYDCHIISLDDINYSYESIDTVTRSATFVYSFMRFTSSDMKKTTTEADTAAEAATPTTEPTGNRSPANMSPEGAKDFVENYKPTGSQGGMQGYSEAMDRAAQARYGRSR